MELRNYERELAKFHLRIGAALWPLATLLLLLPQRRLADPDSTRAI